MHIYTFYTYLSISVQVVCYVTFSQFSKWPKISPQTKLKSNKNVHIGMTQIAEPITGSFWNWVKLPCASNSQSHVLFHARSPNPSSFLLESKRTSKEQIQDGGQRRRHRKRWWILTCKDYKLNDVCHESIIVPIDRLWPNELDMTKIVQW